MKALEVYATQGLCWLADHVTRLTGPLSVEIQLWFYSKMAF